MCEEASTDIKPALKTKAWLEERCEINGDEVKEDTDTLHTAQWGNTQTCIRHQANI